MTADSATPLKASIIGALKGEIASFKVPKRVYIVEALPRNAMGKVQKAALLEVPEVSEAAVIGVPDADLGERIVAFVVVRAPIDPAAIEAHVASRLSPHKRPREVRFLETLPRNAMGKVQKSVLRSLWSAERPSAS